MKHEAIVYSQPGGGHMDPPKGRGAETVTLRDRVRVTAAKGVRAAIFADLGLSVATGFVRAALDSSRVKQVLSDWELPHIDLWAAFPAAAAHAKARALTTLSKKLAACNSVRALAPGISAPTRSPGKE